MGGGNASFAIQKLSSFFLNILSRDVKRCYCIYFMVNSEKCTPSFLLYIFTTLRDVFSCRLCFIRRVEEVTGSASAQ